MTILRKLSLMAFLLAFAGSVFALTLKEARSSGLVGEQLDGYVGVVVSSPEVEALVTSINKRRKEKYQQLAKKNNISIVDVAKIAGGKSIQRAAKGTWIQSASGNWVKK